MSGDPAATSHGTAVREFDAHHASGGGERIVAGLAAGLDRLAELMLDRASTDPETRFGVDSMIMPSSLVKGHLAATLEIELFAAVETAETAYRNGYLAGNESWFLPWLISWRLPDRHHEGGVAARLAVYKAKPADGRRLALETALERALPQATHAPLVLYRMFPLAVEVAAALSFADGPGAQAARKRQLTILPGLADCQTCHGSLLENGDECRICGNPLWKFDWLTAE